MTTLDQATSLRDWLQQQPDVVALMEEPAGSAFGAAHPAFGEEASLKAEPRTPEADLPAPAAQRPAPLLTVASGKGGVGKTFLSINLALAFRDLGRSVLLADLDWGLANVDVALGLCPKLHVGHVLEGEALLQDVLMRHAGLEILPNACGEEAVLGLDTHTRGDLVHDLVRTGADVVVADTHPGIGAFSLDLLLQADHVVLVTTPEPTSLTDSYALFKVLVERDAHAKVSLVVNQAGSGREAARVAAHLEQVAKRYLGAAPQYLGFVPADVSVARSVQEQKAVLAAYAHCPATFAVRTLAHTLASSLALPGGAPRMGPRPLIAAGSGGKLS